ncbi:MAG: hypothetical protein IH974_06025 [Myxococcales bacterium]|nr:hypothetical protein [Myxococcales bacterium]
MGKSNAKHQHPRSLANLQAPWKPGQSGNNAGINQYSYRDEARENLSRWLREKDVTSGQTNGAAFISRICEEAARGNDWAAKMLWQESLKDNPHRFGQELGEAVDSETLSRKLDQIARSEERRDPYALIAFHQAEVDRLRKEYPDAKHIGPDAGRWGTST